MDDSDIARYLGNTLDQVQRYFTSSLAGGITKLKDKPEAWAFVGMPALDAIAQLRQARSCLPPAPTPTFLDCGSGLGFVAALARELGFRASGVEWSEEYVAIAQQMFSWVTTVQGDVLEFANYADYDVIYYYGPFDDEALQQRFEEKVERDAKVGAIILGNRKASQAWRESSCFEALSDEVFMGVSLRKIAAG
jgi:SAM-dependent methyltransferase